MAFARDPGLPASEAPFTARRLDQLPDEEFTATDLTPADVQHVRKSFASWSRDPTRAPVAEAAHQAAHPPEVADPADHDGDATARDGADLDAVMRIVMRMLGQQGSAPVTNGRSARRITAGQRHDQAPEVANGGSSHPEFKSPLGHNLFKP